MPDEGFGLPQSSYGELVRIVRAYNSFDTETVPSEVGKVAAMHETVVSRNNKFLVSIGVLEGGRKKKLTPPGRALARALEHNLSEEIAAKWRDIALSSDFLQKVLAAVRIRNGMDESSLQAHVAYSAGQPNTAGIRAGAAAVIEILKVAGVVKEDNGQIIAAQPADLGVEPRTSTMPASGKQEGRLVLPREVFGGALPQREVLQQRQLSSSLGEAQIRFDFQIHVQCSVDQLSDVGAKLRDLIAELRGDSKSIETKDVSQGETEGAESQE